MHLADLNASHYQDFVAWVKAGGWLAWRASGYLKGVSSCDCPIAAWLQDRCRNPMIFVGMSAARDRLNPGLPTALPDNFLDFRRDFDAGVHMYKTPDDAVAAAQRLVENVP